MGTDNGSSAWSVPNRDRLYIINDICVWFTNVVQNGVQDDRFRFVFQIKSKQKELKKLLLSAHPTAVHTTNLSSTTIFVYICQILVLTQLSCILWIAGEGNINIHGHEWVTPRGAFRAKEAKKSLICDSRPDYMESVNMEIFSNLVYKCLLFVWITHSIVFVKGISLVIFRMSTRLI